MTGSTFLTKHFVKENLLSGLPSHAMGKQVFSLELCRASPGLFILCTHSSYTTGGTILIHQHWCCTTWHDNLPQVELISAGPSSCHRGMACCAPCQSRPGEVFMGQDENEIKESSENALFFIMNKECWELSAQVRSQLLSSYEMNNRAEEVVFASAATSAVCLTAYLLSLLPGIKWSFRKILLRLKRFMSRVEGTAFGYEMASETRISEKSLISKQSNTFTLFVIIIHCCKVFKFAREKFFK